MSSDSTASSTPCTTGHKLDDLDDIKNLFYLETLKRFKDDEANIRRQVEIKYRQYKEAKNDYLFLYSKYASLVQLGLTRSVLEQKCPLDNSQVEKAKENIVNIIKKSSCNSSDYIDPHVLAIFKENLKKCKNYDKLGKIQRDLFENKVAVQAIKTSMENIETTLTAATVDGLDYFVQELDSVNIDADQSI